MPLLPISTGAIGTGAVHLTVGVSCQRGEPLVPESFTEGNCSSMDALSICLMESKRVLFDGCVDSVGNSAVPEIVLW